MYIQNAILVLKGDVDVASMTNAINMSFRVDKTLKKEADELFRKLGLNTSVALNMFLSQSVREQALPFTPSLSPEPNDELKEALKESADILDGKLKAKTYHSVKELIEDLDS